jgi:hypothetical protein
MSIGSANAADTSTKRQPNVLHEMVPHVVLPESIQYNKTAKPLPSDGKGNVSSPYVAAYSAFPSYQVPATAEFKQIEQTVYPVSPKLQPAPLPQPLPEELQEPAELTAPEEMTWKGAEGKDVQLTGKTTDSIQLAANQSVVVPRLPAPNNEIVQTGIFCQHPATPPSAWSFSSPIFKAASVPAGWGGQAGYINQNGPRGCNQSVGFQPYGQPVSGDPNAVGGMPPQGVPYSTFQMGREQFAQQPVPQSYVLPNGMVLLTLPPNHDGCGLIRCRANHSPRNLLLPPAPAGFLPQPAMPQTMLPNGLGTPYMQAAMQQPQMLPQPQIVPITAMTPMGPAVVGYQQVQGINPVSQQAMMSPAMLPQIQTVQATVAQTNPMTALNEESKASAEQPSQQVPAGLIATPYGFYAVQTPATDQSAQAEAAAQQQQAQIQALLQAQLATANPYAGLYATPFGYMSLNQMPMMNAGYQAMGYQPYPAPGFGQPQAGQGGMTVSDLIQIMTFLNANKTQRRARLMDRIAERREARRGSESDPMMQLMQAWTTPYTSPDLTLRQPARNAYPYGYFGVQASPVDSANYGGYHNLYMGNTAYPGLY